MTPATTVRGHVREALKAATDPVHAALHRDPLLSRLSQSCLQKAEYLAALGVFAKFFGAIETCRRASGHWPAFSLAKDCAALAQDVPDIRLDAGFVLSVPTGSQLLGALYVAHGSAFGRGVFRPHVYRALPGLQHHFVSRTSDPRVWRTLVATLEQEGAEADALEHIKTGAHTSFSFMQGLTRAARKAG